MLNFENLNKVYNKLFKALVNANIKNLKNFVLTISSEPFEDYDKNICPILIFRKDSITNPFEIGDQSKISVPTRLTIPISVVDYSTVDFFEANNLVEDLLNKALQTIQQTYNSDLELQELIEEMILDEVVYIPATKLENIWFSEITATLTINFKKQHIFKD
jgi:hypothetical protein